MIERFEIAVSDAVLHDLGRRIARTRWPADAGNRDWGYGTDLTVLRSLADYWRDGFDWRAQEARLDRLPQFRTEIDGVPIHFLHIRGKGPDPMPLVMSHGWPWTFADLEKVIGPLSDPAAYGGDPADAFDLVIPSLPGFAFSTPLGAHRLNFHRTADLWVVLMERLGYARFAAQGGDFGAFVSAQLGHKHADRVMGIHVHLAGPLGMITGNAPPRSDYGEGEEGWFEANEILRDGNRLCLSPGDQAPDARLRHDRFARRHGGVVAGEAARLERLRRRRLSALHPRRTADQLHPLLGDAEFRKRHPLLRGGPARALGAVSSRPAVVTAPTGIAIMANDTVKLPRRWAERYYNLQRWTVIERGGHFAPMEAPGPLTEEIRAFFRTLR